MIECEITNYPEALLRFGREDFESDEEFEFVKGYFKSLESVGIIEETERSKE